MENCRGPSLNRLFVQVATGPTPAYNGCPPGPFALSRTSYLPLAKAVGVTSALTTIGSPTQNALEPKVAAIKSLPELVLEKYFSPNTCCPSSEYGAGSILLVFGSPKEQAIPASVASPKLKATTGTTGNFFIDNRFMLTITSMVLLFSSLIIDNLGYLSFLSKLSRRI